MLDMTNTEAETTCEDCGRTGQPDTFEIHNYIGARKKHYPLPRCIDRKACERRAKQEATDMHSEILMGAASDVAGCRQMVGMAKRALADAVRAALTDNVSPTAIARAAGISRERVYQIRDNRR